MGVLRLQVRIPFADALGIGIIDDGVQALLTWTVHPHGVTQLKIGSLLG